MTPMLLATVVAVPLAHIGHWLWCFYLIPVLIVVGGIVYTTRADKRRERDEEKAGAAKGPASKRRR